MSVNARRALLFMPGDSRKKIEKGATSGADAIIMDLEDGVALSEKDTARIVIAASLREIDFGRTEAWVRLNPVGSPFHEADIAVTGAGRPRGVVLPKTESADHITAVDARLRALEETHGWGQNSIALIAILESALGIVNVREIAASVRMVPRLVALALGAEDLAADMGAVRTPDGLEGAYARGALVLHAKAFGLDAIDSPCVQIAENATLIAETERARIMGYTGKLAIHPRQSALIQTIFTPTQEAINRAQVLIEAYAAHQQKGVGVFSFEGKMIDMPMIRAAETVVAQGRAAGDEVV